MNVCEELKNDCNFLIGVPAIVFDYVSKHACSQCLYVSYIQRFHDDIVERVYGFRRLAHKPFEVNEVIRRTPLMDGCVMKDIYYTQMGGYRTMFEREDHNTRYYGYNYALFEAENFGKWGWESQGHGIFSPILNPEALKNIEKYKYCAYSVGNLMDYLAAYNKDHGVEYFGKLGIIYKASLANKIRKDKQFGAWLRSNVKDVNLYGPTTAIYAYQHHVDFKTAENELKEQREADKDIRAAFYNAAQRKKMDKATKLKIHRYIRETCGYRLYSYRDYISAITYLGYDLNDTKNIMPHDFQRMHDLRVNEYKSAKAKEAAEEKKQLSAKIAHIAMLYADLIYSSGNYAALLPMEVGDFVNEGDALHHCVGKMGYDVKMSKGESIIVFIRDCTNLDKPLVTVEWSPKDKKVLQCYADHDSRPSKEIREWVNQWAERAKKIAIQMAA